jgi:hypothetical protein
MEETSATYVGSPHTPIPTVVGGGITSPPPPSPIRTTVF